MMHCQQNVKFYNAEQATQIYNYKNIKRELYRNNAAIWYNKTCRLKNRYMMHGQQNVKLKFN